MRISPTKFISLLFFVLSVFYLYTAYNIQVFSFDENAPFNARTFPIYLGYAGIFLSVLKILLPEKKTVIVNHKHLDYKSISYLIVISIIYGAVILKVGYFISTSLFLIASELTSCSSILPAIPKKVHIVLSESGVTNIKQVPVGSSSFFFE